MSVEIKDLENPEKIWEKIRKLENFEEKKYHQIFVRFLIMIVEIKEKIIIKSLMIVKTVVEIKYLKIIWKNPETVKNELSFHMRYLARSYAKHKLAKIKNSKRRRLGFYTL